MAYVRDAARAVFLSAAPGTHAVFQYKRCNTRRSGIAGVTTGNRSLRILSSEHITPCVISVIVPAAVRASAHTAGSRDLAKRTGHERYESVPACLLPSVVQLCAVSGMRLARLQRHHGLAIDRVGEPVFTRNPRVSPADRRWMHPMRRCVGRSTGSMACRSRAQLRDATVTGKAVRGREHWRPLRALGTH